MSLINPNNIDGQYPIAGQDNDSQGFRDNFTNIKNNFTIAYNELADLQGKVVLKSALSGGSIDNNMSYSILEAAQLKKAVETKRNLGTISGPGNDISWADGHFQYFTTSGDTTIGLSGWPTNSTYAKLRLQITTDTTNRVITFPAAVSVGLADIQGAVGQTITLPTAGVYLFELTTVDNGTTITIQDLLRNYDIVTTGASGAFTILNVGTPLANVRTTGNVIGGLAQFASINSTPIGNATPSTGAFSTLSATGAITSSGGGIGYAAGAGGTIAQGSGSEKNTTVVLNKTTGTITLNGGICFANARVANAFTLTNSTIGNQDLVVIQHVDVGALGGYSFAANTAVAGGSATISVRNHTQLDLSEAIVIRFAVIKSTDA